MVPQNHHLRDRPARITTKTKRIQALTQNLWRDGPINQEEIKSDGQFIRCRTIETEKRKYDVVS